MYIVLLPLKVHAVLWSVVTVLYAFVLWFAWRQRMDDRDMGRWKFCLGVLLGFVAVAVFLLWKAWGK